MAFRLTDLFILYFFIQNVHANKKLFKKKGYTIMYKGSNCDRKSQLSEILTKPLNPRVKIWSIYNCTLETFSLNNNAEIKLVCLSWQILTNYFLSLLRKSAFHVREKFLIFGEKNNDIFIMFYSGKGLNL